MLAEIQLHIGQPSLPAVSGDHALPAGSLDADALLGGVFADDPQPEGLCARGSSMQELAVTPFALDFESEGLCARGTLPFEDAHVEVGHAGQVFVVKVGKTGSLCSGSLPEAQEPVELPLCSRVCLSLDSALGQAECEPEGWQLMVVPQGLFVQFSVGVECELSGRPVEMPLTKEGAGFLFRRYGKVHIEKEIGGSRTLVTFELAHQARAAQQHCDRLPMAKIPGALQRVRFLGLVSWPGTNRLHRSCGSAAVSSGLGAGEHFATVDGAEPLDLAVPQPPTRPGNGKGKSQREFASSLVASLPLRSGLRRRWVSSVVRTFLTTTFLGSLRARACLRSSERLFMSLKACPRVRGGGMWLL